MAALVECRPDHPTPLAPLDPEAIERRGCLDRLAAARSADDRAALRRCESAVVERFRPYADRIARRFRGRGVEDDDLRQLARLGLCKAVQRWRPELDPGLTHFASPTIEGEIKRYFRDHCRPIRMPRSLQEDLAMHQAAEEDLVQALGLTPTDADVATAAGSSVERVRRQRLASRVCQPVTADADDGAAITRIGCERAAQAMNRVVEQIDLGAAVRQLSPRDRRVLALRFVGELSQSEIAEHLGVSQMQVSRILRALMIRLRTAMV
ncbi:sigma-70 family RNA polymerase sigma factor [Nakamurella sp.]|uniref:sigma-70 family RNA polymerase sigma factor n=1 Tax=Nakamurella sp. TaxID=1869182 RepID=UPI003B3A133A